VGASTTSTGARGGGGAAFPLPHANGRTTRSDSAAARAVPRRRSPVMVCIWIESFRRRLPGGFDSATRQLVLDLAPNCPCTFVIRNPGPAERLAGRRLPAPFLPDALQDPGGRQRATHLAA